MISDNQGVHTERGLRPDLKWKFLLSPPGDAGRYRADVTEHVKRAYMPSNRRTPSPYGLQVGASITALLQLFSKKVPDPKSNQQVLELAKSKDWTTAHDLRDQVRNRYLRASNSNEKIKCQQYSFEESCLETLYNDTDPDDPFDSISPYWVVPSAIGLATTLEIPIDDVITAMHPTEW
jgi:hypothetical protein